MSRVCQVTGKRPMSGNNVSHANNKTRRRFDVNLKEHKFWVPSQNRFVKLRVSVKGMRIIDKKGIEAVLKDIEEREKKAFLEEMLHLSPQERNEILDNISKRLNLASEASEV